MKIIKGGITAPEGFKTAGDHVGIKKRRRDLAIILSEIPATASAVFTQNVVKAAPLLWCQKVLAENHKIRAIVVNSGNANACTGEQGYEHAVVMAEITAECLNLDKNEVLVSSTGVIGVPLDIELIKDGIKKVSGELDCSEKSSIDAAQAIMTTDTFHKEIAVEFEISGKPVRLAGIAKGSGMIHPDMATMLAFITTDADISKEMLDKALKDSVVNTYNMISVDGDTSTNDMAIIIANAKAGNPVIEIVNEEYKKFKEALDFVNEHLAKQIVYDGEGASKFLEVNINGAKSSENARKLAKSIISSNLVKTAFFGEDANWGRIIAAMGYSGGTFNPDTVSIEFFNNGNTIKLMENGKPLVFDENKALEILKNREIKINIDLKDGNDKASAWGCDLSYEYVRINGEYRT